MSESVNNLSESKIHCDQNKKHSDSNSAFRNGKKLLLTEGMLIRMYETWLDTHFVLTK